MNDAALSRLTRVSQALAKIKTMKEAAGYAKQADALKTCLAKAGKSTEAQNDAADLAVRFQRRAGELSRELPKDQGLKGQPKRCPHADNVPTKTSALADAGVSRQAAYRMEAIASLPEDKFEEVVAKVREDSGELTTRSVYREARRFQTEEKAKEIASMPVAKPDGIYSTIVVDPPWEMEKIERDVAPGQAAFDYPTMSVEEISVMDLIEKHADDAAHVFLWTTQKYLPSAFAVMAGWGVRYVFTMVWYKPGGFQPFNLPQYNCEFCLYGRIGSPDFVETKAFYTANAWPRAGHSVKPEGFYELLRRVTPEPRLDVFNRRKIEGFTGWGNQSE